MSNDVTNDLGTIVNNFKISLIYTVKQTKATTACLLNQPIKNQLRKYLSHYYHILFTIFLFLILIQTEVGNYSE